MLEVETCAVKCLGAMDRALGGRRSRSGREAGVAKELPAEVDGRMSAAAVILWQKKLEQPPLARPLSTALHRTFWVSRAAGHCDGAAQRHCLFLADRDEN